MPVALRLVQAPAPREDDVRTGEEPFLLLAQRGGAPRKAESSSMQSYTTQEASTCSLKRNARGV